eukprot:2779993-Ditylum_brightwellii.AAC.1
MKQVANTPVVFVRTQHTQKQSSNNFSHVVEAASALALVQWALGAPKFGHFLQAAAQTGHKCDPVFVIERDVDCRDILQKYWKTNTIFSTVSAAIRFLTKSMPSPLIRAYYVVIPSDMDTNDRAVYTIYQSVLIDLMVTHRHLLLAVIESYQELLTSELKQAKKRSPIKTLL